MQQEFLRQIFCLGFRVTACANELVKRRPIPVAQVFHRLASDGFTAHRRLRQESPLGRGKVHGWFRTLPSFNPSKPAATELASGYCTERVAGLLLVLCLCVCLVLCLCLLPPYREYKTLPQPSPQRTCWARPELTEEEKP